MRPLLSAALLAFVLVAFDRVAARAAGVDSTYVAASADTLAGEATSPPAPPAKRARLSAPT